MKRFVLFICIVCAIVGCAEMEEGSIDSISLSSEELVFGANGGTKNITIESSGDWRVSGVADWVEPLSTSGKNGESLLFKASPNTTGERREVVFKVFSGNAVCNLKVSSELGSYIELLSAEKETVSPKGDILTVALNTNVKEFEFDYGGADWISYKGQREAFGRTMVDFTIEQGAFKSREGKVTIKGKGTDYAAANLTVSQGYRNGVVTETPVLKGKLSGGAVTLQVRSNVEYEMMAALPDWIELTGSTKGESVDDDGLVTDTYTFNLKAADWSRLTKIGFSYNNEELLSVVVKQASDNPIFTNITDSGLRMMLTNANWIYAENSETTECEVMLDGYNATKLTISPGTPQQPTNIKVVDGLGGFPNLNTVEIPNNSTVETIDLTGSESINTLTIGEMAHKIKAIKTGDSPVTEVVLKKGYATWLDYEQLEISGEKITYIEADTESIAFQLGYEKLKRLDVRQCPNLKKVSAIRKLAGFDVALTEIYVSAAQKSAIDAGTIVAEKADETQIIVK